MTKLDEILIKSTLGDRPVFFLAPRSDLGVMLSRSVANICANVVAVVDDSSPDSSIHGIQRWTSNQFIERAKQYPSGVAVDFSTSWKAKVWARKLCESAQLSVFRIGFFRADAKPSMLAIDALIWKPHLETAGEILLDSVDTKETAFSYVGGYLPWRDYEIAPPKLNKFFDSGGKGRVRQFERILEDRGVSVLDCPEIPLCLFAEIKKWAADFSGDISTLKAYSYKGCALGFGIVSSLISKYRNPNINTDELSGEIKLALEATALVYERALTLISGYEPDVVLTFNGRFALSFAITKAAEACGVRILFHERGCDYKKYEIYDGSTHSMIRLRGRIERCWSEVMNIDEARAKGEDFFQRRRNGDGIGWRSFTDKQIKDQVIPRNSKRRIVYFSSSDDEYAAVEDGMIPRFAPLGQKDAILRLVAVCKKIDDVELLIRMHPNSAGSDASTLNWLLELESDGITVLPPLSSVDSYALAESADVVCTYASTMGVEAAYWGTASILLGDSGYAGSGACFEPQDDAELEQLLRHVPTEWNREACIKFGYFFSTFGKEYKYYKPSSLFDGEFLENELSW